MVFLQQTPKVFKKKGDKHMGDVALRKGKEKKRRGEVSVSTASPRSSTASTIEIRSKKAPMRLQRPDSRHCALSHSANSASVVGSLFLQNESEFTQMPRISPENQSNQQFVKVHNFFIRLLSYL